MVIAAARPTVAVPSTTTGASSARRPTNPRNAGKPGDLMVKLEVIVPTELNDEQRAAVESLAKVTDEAPRAAVEG